jgi:hypothetical protein
MTVSTKRWIAVGALAITLNVLAFALGRHTSHNVTWLSELFQRTQGREIYFISFPIQCTNGKQLGQFQADLNLTNGKVRIIRNDAGLAPDCTK